METIPKGDRRKVLIPLRAGSEELKDLEEIKKRINARSRPEVVRALIYHYKKTT